MNELDTTSVLKEIKVSLGIEIDTGEPPPPQLINKKNANIYEIFPI